MPVSIEIQKKNKSISNDELDIIFERFIKKYSESLLDDEFYELERILNLPDQLIKIARKENIYPLGLNLLNISQSMDSSDLGED